MMRLTTLGSSTPREAEKPHLRPRRATSRRSATDTRAEPFSGGIASLQVSRKAVSSSPLSFMLGIAAHSTAGALFAASTSRACCAVVTTWIRCIVGFPSVAMAPLSTSGAETTPPACQSATGPLAVSTICSTRTLACSLKTLSERPSSTPRVCSFPSLSRA
ncbi:MAG: hypothetical protein MUF64_03780 [Polyangiaceae bacterium]|nr:hypothetical protein [Polyangiaceae bacterium]